MSSRCAILPHCYNENWLEILWLFFWLSRWTNSHHWRYSGGWRQFWLNVRFLFCEDSVSSAMHLRGNAAIIFRLSGSMTTRHELGSAEENAAVISLRALWASDRAACDWPFSAPVSMAVPSGSSDSLGLGHWGDALRASSFTLSRTQMNTRGWTFCTGFTGNGTKFIHMFVFQRSLFFSCFFLIIIAPFFNFMDLCNAFHKLKVCSV